jgi:hypothetical protein
VEMHFSIIPFEQLNQIESANYHVIMLVLMFSEGSPLFKIFIATFSPAVQVIDTDIFTLRIQQKIHQAIDFCLSL